MIVYHGSNHNFKHLRISESLREKQSTLSNEGLGIYFSTNKDVAKEYGKYLYTLEIRDDAIADFTKKSVCQIYIDSMIQSIDTFFGIDVLDYIPELVDMIIERMKWGGQCIFQAGKELFNCLDSSEAFWCDGKISETKRRKLQTYLNNYDKKHLLAYTFTYHIKDIGVLKTTDENVVRIIKKEVSYESMVLT